MNKTLLIKDVPFSYIGQTFECTKAMDELETCLNVGMLVQIVSVSPSVKQDGFNIKLDTRPYQGHNRSKMIADYFNEQGEACLTAVQAGHWPKDEIHEVFFSKDDNFNDYFQELEG